MIKTTIAMLAVCICLLTGIFNMAQITNGQFGTSVIAAKHTKQVGGDDYAVVLPSDLSAHQFEILQTAYDIAKKDGNPHPEKFQGIILTESGACDKRTKYKVAGQEFGGKERYYGCGQVKLVAAKAVLQRHPELWKYMQTREDDEIIANLILNDRFNLEVASKFFMMMNNGRADNTAIAAYNQGPLGVKSVNPDTFHYTLAVNRQSQSKFVKAANMRH
jgi:hypothetical protein